MQIRPPRPDRDHCSCGAGAYTSTGTRDRAGDRAAAETYRIKGSSVNVRSEPSTSGRILVQLGNGTEVVYVKRYDNDWAVINYDGQEAYVSSKYIEKVEPVASTGGETEGSEAQTAN